MVTCFVIYIPVEHDVDGLEESVDTSKRTFLILNIFFQKKVKLIFTIKVNKVLTVDSIAHEFEELHYRITIFSAPAYRVSY